MRWGRNNRKTLGAVGILLPTEARENAQRVLGNVAHARDPDHGLHSTVNGLTLGEFINGKYADWSETHFVDSTATLKRLTRCFGHWFDH